MLIFYLKDFCEIQLSFFGHVHWHLYQQNSLSSILIKQTYDHCLYSIHFNCFYALS